MNTAGMGKIGEYQTSFASYKTWRVKQSPEWMWKEFCTLQNPKGE